MASRRFAIAHSERFWEQLTQLIEEESVVPVVGQDLLFVEHEGRRRLLYPFLAERLAEHLGVSAQDLPRREELFEVARRYLAGSNEVSDLYHGLRIVLRELDGIAVPEPLLKLARITSFKLYVTTTFDFLMERALNQERFDGQRQTLVFTHAPTDKQDLPREFDRVRRPAVFHLLGRLSATPQSYAVTRDDFAEFVRLLQSKDKDAPNLLLDKLKRSNLLVLGSHFDDWLTSFFVRHTRSGRRLETEVDLVPNPGENTAQGGVFLLQHFGGGAKITRASGALGFIDELYRRVHDARRVEESETPSSILELVSSTGIQSGAVFVSYAEADRDAAESIRDALDRAGVDVIFGNDDLDMGGKWERKLRDVISSCALFVPVLSRRASSAQRRFFRPDWVEAILEAKELVPSGPFILPVAVDDVRTSRDVLPSDFGAPAWESLPLGGPSSEFVDKVVQFQRSYRSASLA